MAGRRAIQIPESRVETNTALIALSLPSLELNARAFMAEERAFQFQRQLFLSFVALKSNHEMNHFGLAFGDFQRGGRRRLGRDSVETGERERGRGRGRGRGMSPLIDIHLSTWIEVQKGFLRLLWPFFTLCKISVGVELGSRCLLFFVKIELALEHFLRGKETQNGQDIRTMKLKCRVWWPRPLLSSEPDLSLILFGWFVHSSFASLDVVVANATPVRPALGSLSVSDLQRSLCAVNGEMSMLLQNHATYTVLGYCRISNDYEMLDGRLADIQTEEVAAANATNCTFASQLDSQKIPEDANCGKHHEAWQCGCQKLDGVPKSFKESCSTTGNWIQFSFSHIKISKEVSWIPRLHHIHFEGKIFSCCHVHVIMYDQPNFGAHHFSSIAWNYFERQQNHLKRPKWVTELERRQQLSDLDIVLLVLNSADAAKMVFDGYQVSPSIYKQLIWSCVAIFFASISTLLYFILQLCQKYLNCGSRKLYKTLAAVLCHTWKNVHIRCCQLLYWPIFLQGSSSRSESSVEYAHHAAIRKHAMWSSIAVDILLGNVVGVFMYIYAEAIYNCILYLASEITNSILRSGCVWLMGVPAGFKLNNEFATVLGMISLNATQIWSTIWFFMSFFLPYFIKGVAISGIMFGVTVPAAFLIDVLKLVTLHLSALHWFISLLYSLQIQALASLWRLFRGRKWNPLRQRLDSYDYTVEQHVVGSLLFTPVLLLLPTTSVFYIFFTIMKTTMSCICMLVEVTISVHHATPYAEIFLRMMKPQRFPSGVWFEILSVQSMKRDTSPAHVFVGDGLSLANSAMPAQQSIEVPEMVISFLHSNIACIEQIILPHYRKVFYGVSLSSSASWAYDIFSGKSVPSALNSRLPSPMPWIHMPYNQYWCLCHDLVLAFGLGNNPGLFKSSTRQTY
ncbi:hypothetical protein H6P81_011770 [Aristolochia fimbriata]|uniref:Uncharacterized protein n=1 Tax=Aristolochia fimbriata TaxID=158543 RepID=A0AAV7E9W4_ARIFI|nr:hypothetical protein H6P81_011770 [Aristolochia fimbriata]